MKVILEPSKDQSSAKIKHYRVVVEVPNDDITMSELGDLMRAAAIAQTYAEKSVYEELGHPNG